jgi:IclR family acetate operon transcriptional repressor
MVMTKINRKALAPSSDRCLAILELLSLHAEGLTLSDIHHLLGISKNMIFRILNDLTSRGYIHKAESKTYSLGNKLLELAIPQTSGKNLVEESIPEIKALRDITQEGVGLLVPCGHEAVLIYFQPSRQPVRIIYDVGIRVSLYCNAPGKVFLAFGDERTRASRLKQQSFKRFTERTITEPTKLQDELEIARTNGYTIDCAEEVEGAYCVAAPIYDHDNYLVAAIVVTGPHDRITQKMLPSFGKRVAQTATRISNRLK